MFLNRVRGDKEASRRDGVAGKMSRGLLTGEMRGKRP